MKSATKTSFILIAFVLSGPSSSSGDFEAAPRPLPPAAEAIVAKMDAEIVAIKRRTICSLEKLLRETTKKGDLEAAIAIKEEIDRLTQEASASRSAQRVSFVGRWRSKDGATFDVFPDGRLANSGGIKGRWAPRGNYVELEWDNGVRATIQPDNDGFIGKRTLSNGAVSDVSYMRVGSQ